MSPKGHEKAHDEEPNEGDLSQDHLALLVVAGCLAAYIIWRVHEHEPIVPSRLAPHLTVTPPTWLLPSAIVAVFLSAVGLALWLRRWSTRRLARRVTRALIEAGLEGRNPRNPEKPIRPQLRSMSREGRQVWLLGFRMPVKGSAITIDQIRPHLEQHLDCSIQTWADGGLVWLRLGTHKLPRQIGFDDLAGAIAGKELPVAIGVSREGELVVDLTDLPHLLVGGVTGGGKSVLLRGLLTRLVIACPNERLQVVLADLKGGMEFTLFKGLPHLFCPVVSDREAFLDAMEVLCAELVRRMKLYGDREVESLKRWNREHPDQRMPYLVVVVDELAEVTSKGTGDREEQQQRRRAVHAISQIARLGRAVGIHMILCTQRPDAEIVEGQAKSNMGATLAFRTRDAIQSQILLGPGDVTASQIPAGIPGRGIWKWIDSGIQVQTPLLEVDRARELLAGVKRGCTAPGGSRPATFINGETKLPRPEALDAEMTSELSADQQPDPDYGAPEFASFDLTRLAVGRRYEFTLADGGKVMGVLRELEVSSSDRDEPSLRVTDESHDQYLDPRQVVAVRRSRGQS